MSDDNKDLGNDLNDMLDDAKDGARKAGDKISQKANEFKGDAKEKASEFSGDAQKAFDDGKNVGIIAHITLIGWVIALIMNNGNKTEIGSFYIRQVLGIGLIGLLTSWIPIVNLIAWLVVVVAWIMSLISSLNGEMKPTFLLGKQFQEWFKSL